MRYLINKYYTSSSINFRMIFKELGLLLMVESAFMAVPLVVSLFCGESDWSAFAISTAASLATGLALFFLSLWDVAVHIVLHSFERERGFF